MTKPKIRGFSCSTGSLPAVAPLSARLQLIRLLGFSCVDVVITDVGEPSTEAVATSGRAASRLRAHCEQQALSVSDVFLVPGADFEQLALNHPRREVRDAFDDLFGRTLEFAKQLNAPGVTILPGMEWAGEERGASVARAVSELSRYVGRGKGAGLDISVEPHRWSAFAAPDEVLDLLAAVDGLSVTLDFSHFVFQGIAQAALDPLLPRVRHLHVRGARRGRMHTPLVWNEIDFERVLLALGDVGYAGYVALECEPVPHDREDADAYDVLSETVRLRSLLSALVS